MREYILKENNMHGHVASNSRMKLFLLMPSPDILPRAVTHTPLHADDVRPHWPRRPADICRLSSAIGCVRLVARWEMQVTPGDARCCARFPTRQQVAVRRAR